MVKRERTYPAPKSLEKRQSYNEEDVTSELDKIFNHKCYICELPNLQDGLVEHRVSHKGNDDLKYDWDNLFWSCPHCNQWKNQERFEKDVIDCCHQNPENHIQCKYDPYSSEVVVNPKDNDVSSVVTAELLDKVFNRANTGIRKIAQIQRRRALKEELNKFQKLLNEYCQNKSDYKRKKIRALLRTKTAFAAFKRDYIREHQDEYKEFQEFVN